MHHFQYHNGELYCENVPIRTIAVAVGTPMYIYSQATLTRHYVEFDKAFQDLPQRLICFSAKANSSMAVLRLLSGLGSGLDIVSGGELYRGLHAGVPPQRVVYSGVGKRVDEIDYALASNILMFNIESLEELALIDARAGALGKKAAIAIRVNPDVDPQTHPYISTGLKKNKFGIDTRAALEGYKLAVGMPNIRVEGIDCHIGSQITSVEPFEDALKSLKDLILTLAQHDIQIRRVDMGGGLGITYNAETPPHPREYAQAILRVLDTAHLQLILEPGRVIAGNAGILVTAVLYRKPGDYKNFLVTDAGMNDLMRPALYGAFHDIWPIKQSDDRPLLADVVGPICESSDFLAQERHLPHVAQGDLLAVMSAGAYGFTMASNYCSRLRVPEVLVKGEQFQVVRAREQYRDLVAGETVPPFIADAN